MKCVLSIAGSDSSGGAGIQADLKTFEYFGCYGCSVITVLTAQNTVGVQNIHPIEADFVKQQLDSVMNDMPVAAVKIGMLFEESIIDVIHEFLKELGGKIPVILDPVAVANSGAVLLKEEAIEKLKALFPLATLITPNRREFAHFFSRQVDTVLELETDYTKYRTMAGVDMVVKNLKDESGLSTDVLLTEKGTRLFQTSELVSEQTHGSGCTFSSAIAASLANGLPLEDALLEAKKYVFNAIAQAPGFGAGGGPLRHHLERS